MRALTQLILPLFTLSLLITLFIAGSALAKPLPQIGKAAPDFRLRDRDGALTSLGNLAYSGKERASRPKQVVVLDFFRTDCKPCKKSMPELIKLHKELKDKPVKILLIALLEEEEGEEKLDRYFSAHPLPFPVLMDSYQSVAKNYVMEKGSLSIPKLFIIDRNGVLRAKYDGLQEKQVDKVKGQIKRLTK